MNIMCLPQILEHRKYTIDSNYPTNTMLLLYSAIKNSLFSLKVHYKIFGINILNDMKIKF